MIQEIKELLSEYKTGEEMIKVRIQKTIQIAGILMRC